MKKYTKYLKMFITGAYSLLGDDFIAFGGSQ